MLGESFIQDLHRNIGVPVSRFFFYEVDRLEHPAHTAGAELVLERESPLENGARTDGPRCPGNRLRRRHGPRTRRQGRIVIADTRSGGRAACRCSRRLYGCIVVRDQCSDRWDRRVVVVGRVVEGLYRCVFIAEVSRGDGDVIVRRHVGRTHAGGVRLGLCQSASHVRCVLTGRRALAKGLYRGVLVVHLVIIEITLRTRRTLGRI